MFRMKAIITDFKDIEDVLFSLKFMALISATHPRGEVINTPFWKKKEDEIPSATEMQLIRALLVLPMRVIPALVLHGIAREHGFAI